MSAPTIPEHRRKLGAAIRKRRMALALSQEKLACATSESLYRYLPANSGRTNPLRLPVGV